MNCGTLNNLFRLYMNKSKNLDPPAPSDCNSVGKNEKNHVEEKKMYVSGTSVVPNGPFEVVNSYIDDCFMPAWDHVIKYKHKTAYKNLNEVVNVEDLWQDPNGMMELNQRQKKRFHCWIRYFNLCCNVHFFKAPPSSDRILQGYVGDCSTVASLSSLSEYEKLNYKVLTDKIKLIDLKRTIKKLKKLSYPKSSIEYLKSYKIAIGVKIHFNGCARCLFVDDWVPIKRDCSLLCAHSSDPDELWVTMFEKACVRLYGRTYSIRGTNPGIDIYHFTGWLPEIVQLPPFRYKMALDKIKGSNYNVDGCDETNEIPNLEKWDLIWNSIVHNFNRNIVVCVGTNELYDVDKPDHDVEGISVSSGIVSCHAYSVLDVLHLELKDVDYKLLLLKNPWGKASSKLPLDPKVIKMLPYYKNGYDENNDSGVFWIEWINVLKWFSHVYMCWNWRKFEYTNRLYFNWNRSTHFMNSLVPEDTYLSLHNPQMLITTRDDCEDSYRNGCDEEDEDEDDFVIFVILIQIKKTLDDKMKYLAIHTFLNKIPIVSPYNPAVNGVYNNCEVILFKLLVGKMKDNEYNMLRYGKYNSIKTSKNEIDLVLLVCHFMKKIENDNSFTIVTFSNREHQFKLFPSLTDKLNNIFYDFKWTDYSSGMNPNEMWSFISNPHFRLELKRDLNMILMLETDTAVSVNLRLFFSRIATIRALRTKLAHSSGDYRLHCCVIKGRFLKGTYTIIPSNFNGTKARFRFNIFHPGSNDDIELYPIPYPHIKLGDIFKNNVPTCSEYTRDRVLCGSYYGKNAVDKEYKIDTSNCDPMGNGSMVVESDSLIYNTLKFYQIPDHYNVTVARMINDYFEFKVERPTLVSIKIKVNSPDDNKFVLFSGHCMKYPAYSPVFCNSVNSGYGADSGQRVDNKNNILTNLEDDNMDLDDVGREFEDGSGSSKFCDNVSCIKCGGPYGQFYPTDADLFPDEYKLGFEYFLFSDLNGGISRNGRSPSSSCQVLFLREQVVNFTLVTLFPNVEYRLKSVNHHMFQTVFFISTSCTIST